MGRSGKLQLRRDLKALWERYEAIKDSPEAEDKEEAKRLLRQHEHVRMELID
jgi:hypothetical protein